MNELVSENPVRINKSMLMKAAWTVLRKKEAETISEALKKAWRAYKLKAKMSIGVVSFTFKKANGEIRKAVGTLASSLFNYEYKGTGNEGPTSCIRYWDVEKKAFRSFKVASLM